MEVSAEAKRIMVVALGKLYSSRTQRGGLRLHRSLLLTLVMKSARDIYHEAQTTAPNDASGCEQQQQQQQQRTTEKLTEPHQEPRGQSALSTEQSRTLPPQEVVGSPAELSRYARTDAGAENKENLWPGVPAQHSRKRRGKAAAEPDFLPCKKAKLEQGISPQQLIVTAVLTDYVTCGSEMGAAPAPTPLHRAVAVC